MEVQCPLCKVRHHLDAASTQPRHWALCPECRFRYAQGWRGGIAGGLTAGGDPVLMVDADARLLACNRPAELLFGAPQAVLLGLAPGELLDCDRAKASACGASPDCHACGLQQAILYALRHDRDCERLPVLLPVKRQGQAQMRCLSVSTRRQGQAVRVQLEEDGFLPLH